MNKADSERLAIELSQLGYYEVPKPEEADIVILNSCAVRQSAEDKVANKLSNLKVLKRKASDVAIALTGCMVDSNTEDLRERFPYVDFFCKPQQFDDLLKYAQKQVEPVSQPSIATDPKLPTAFVPIIQGCNNFCSYCIVPYRRGREKSRLVDDIIRQIEQLTANGIREVTLVGQNVDSYGHDLSDTPDLADLLTEVNRIDGLARIRFLTSHPKDMSQKLVEAIASLEKVCEHISLPAQAGDNEILKAMRRGYTIEQYKDLINRIRDTVPDVALSNDIIVGFPGETETQFHRTFDLLEKFEFDTVHVAAYSPRSGTIAARKMKDNVPAEEKQRRLKLVEELQERVSRKKNSGLLETTVQILVEGQKKGKWQGRTRSDKLVFFESDADCTGELIAIRIDHAGPWSLSGAPATGAIHELSLRAG